MGWSELIGSHLGGYEIEAEIARGGMSRVYRAHEIDSLKPAALKVMTLGDESDDGQGNPFNRRFEHEAHAIERLDHPNIVKVFAAGSSDDFLFIAMQLVTGGTFRQRLGKPMAITDACALMIQMARALHHAHSHHVIHRDVKPANMLIDDSDPDHLLLADFGIAKIIGQKGVTKTGTAVGTPEYMAPEQAKGEEIDQRADIYGLACVLYETLAGRPPFVGPTALSICYQHVHTRPAYIRGFNPDVPRALALVLEQALAKSPRDRFASAEDFAVALYPFTEPAGHVVRRTAPLAQPVDLDLRGTPDYLADISPNPESLPPSTHEPAPARDPLAAAAMLDLSDVGARRAQSQPIMQDDLTARQTQEMTPVSQPARPRHTRPLQPALTLRSRPIAPREGDRLTPAPVAESDLTRFSTIKTPVPPFLPVPPSKRRGSGIPRNRLLLLLGAALLIGVLAILILGQFSQRKAGVALLPTATIPPQATMVPTTAVESPTVTTATATQIPTTNVAAEAVYLSYATTGADTTCNFANNKTHFSPGQHVYITSCVAAGYGPGTITNIIFQNGVNKIAISNKDCVGKAGYYLGYNVPLSAGNYEVVIQWNGQQARTITFTVS